MKNYSRPNGGKIIKFQKKRIWRRRIIEESDTVSLYERESLQ